MQTTEQAAPAEQAFKQLSETEKAAEWTKFESIIYAHLERILEKRPTLPVTRFAKA